MQNGTSDCDILLTNPELFNAEYPMVISSLAVEFTKRIGADSDIPHARCDALHGIRSKSVITPTGNRGVPRPDSDKEIPGSPDSKAPCFRRSDRTRH